MGQAAKGSNCFVASARAVGIKQFTPSGQLNSSATKVASARLA